MAETSPVLESCHSCREPIKECYPCEMCKNIRYCSIACRAKDSAGHKDECRNIGGMTSIREGTFKVYSNPYFRALNGALSKLWSQDGGYVYCAICSVNGIFLGLMERRTGIVPDMYKDKYNTDIIYTDGPNQCRIMGGVDYVTAETQYNSLSHLLTGINFETSVPFCVGEKFAVELPKGRFEW